MAAEQDDVEQRKEYVRRIVQSSARLKIVVAGPGTGKSTAFKMVLESVPSGERLALSFINNLVRDLQKDLAGLAEAKTFHAYSRGLLHRRASDGLTTEFHYYPPLEHLVAADAGLLNEELPSVDFTEALNTLNETDDRIRFFLERASFYNAVGFEDSVYRVLKTFQGDTSRVPVLDYLIVDEFQDFNRLEVAFLEHLERTSPTLIAGDDDQAIYQTLRHARPSFIREKYGAGTHEPFELPYCSRCTRVLVEATNAFIQQAQANGLLQGRLSKAFRPFSGKDKDSAAYPKIIAVKCAADTVKGPQIAQYIAHEIEAIAPDIRTEAADPEKGYPLALVLGPGQYLKRIHQLLDGRIPNVVYSPRKDMAIELIDGYRALLKETGSNLGWRIVLECCLHSRAKRIVKKSHEGGTSIQAALPEEFVAEHIAHLERLRRGVDDEAALTAVEWGRLSELLGITKDEIIKKLKAKDTKDEDDQPRSRNGSVILTSYMGAKGLSAGVVFVVGMEEGGLPKSNSAPNDEEANQFIVALTRARKQGHLLHAGRFMGNRKSPSVFLRWVPRDMLEVRKINAEKVRSWSKPS